MAKKKVLRAKGKGWVGWTSGPPEPHVPRAWNDPSFVPPPRVPERPTAVKLMPEYSCELPLWLCEWWELDLPTQLLNELADWQEQFDSNFDPFERWKNEGVRDAWAARANELYERLRLAVPEGVTVTVDLWPTEPDSDE